MPVRRQRSTWASPKASRVSFSRSPSSSRLVRPRLTIWCIFAKFGDEGDKPIEAACILHPWCISCRAMLRVLETVGEVVDQLGGTAEVARRYSTPQQTLTMAAVTNWRRRGRMAPRLFLRMRADRRAAGCTARPELWAVLSPDGESAPCEAASA